MEGDRIMSVDGVDTMTILHEDAVKVLQDIGKREVVFLTCSDQRHLHFDPLV